MPTKAEDYSPAFELVSLMYHTRQGAFKSFFFAGKGPLRASVGHVGSFLALNKVRAGLVFVGVGGVDGKGARGKAHALTAWRPFLEVLHLRVVGHRIQKGPA